MSFHSWRQNLRSALAARREQRHPRRRGAPRAGTQRLSLEALEDRLTPSFGWDGAYYSEPPGGTAFTPSPPLLADFTSDGILDQLSVNFLRYELAIRPGRGNGTFGDPIVTGIYTPNGAKLGVADFNADGRRDVFVASNADYLGVMRGETLLGRGDGSFYVADGLITLDFYYPFEFPLGIGAKVNSTTGRTDLVIGGGNSVDPTERTYVVLVNNGDWEPSAPDTKTYVGPNNSNWSTASNWSPSGVPTAADLVSISGKSVSLSSSATVARLALTGGASLTVSQNGSRVLQTGVLSIITSSKLDLKDNDLIIDYSGPSPSGSWNGVAYTGITGLIQSGRNGGAWNGTGIVTTSASGNRTTLGVAEIAGDVVVKFTYAGDATLDGKINVDDYGRIDFNAKVPGANGWFNGDFNYDGKINVDDYGIIDSNVAAQGPSLVSAPASAATWLARPMQTRKEDVFAARSTAAAGLLS